MSSPHSEHYEASLVPFPGHCVLELPVGLAFLVSVIASTAPLPKKVPQYENDTTQYGSHASRKITEHKEGNLPKPWRGYLPSDGKTKPYQHCEIVDEQNRYLKCTLAGRRSNEGESILRMRIQSPFCAQAAHRSI